jgi:hypothetical protein
MTSVVGKITHFITFRSRCKSFGRLLIGGIVIASEIRIVLYVFTGILR